MTNRLYKYNYVGNELTFEHSPTHTTIELDNIFSVLTAKNSNLWLKLNKLQLCLMVNSQWMALMRLIHIICIDK